ncbi:MAG: hypothetical protein GXO92_07240 [FCB group bacterium]|nr:hypothetical protein [FCB group bacterium]
MCKTLFGFFILIGIALSQTSSVNDSSLSRIDYREKFTRNSILLQYSFLKGRQFIIDGKSYPVGFFNSELKEALSPVPEAVKLVDAGNANIKYGLITTLFGFSFSFYTLFRDVTFPEDIEKNIPDAILVLSAGSLAADYFYMQATNYFHKAVWLYNRESAFLPLRPTANGMKNKKAYTPGYSSTLVKSDLYVLGYRGNLYSLRLGKWEKPWMENGIEVSYTKLRDHNQSADLWRLYYYYGFYLRQMGVFYPFLVVSTGFAEEPKHAIDREEGAPAGSSVKGSSAVKVGIAVEAGAFRLSMETGGGSMGTGHVEPSSISLSYALKPLPKAKPYRNYSITAGTQSFVATTGKYRGDPGGFDFNLRREVKGKTRNYNAGIFMTDYIMSTGVFHGGVEWSINKGKPLSRYLDIMTGYQILLWGEPDPDFILPAASLSIDAKLPIWKLMLFARLRAIGTVSPKAGIVTGVLLSSGFGFAD